MIPEPSPVAPPSPSPVAAPATHLLEIESLRGIAIALVCALHTDAIVRHPPYGLPSMSSQTEHVLLSPALAFVRAGNTGVTLFFVISGFLLSLPFLAQAAGGRPVRVSTYYRRRALRILPAYYAAVAVAVALTARSAGDVLRALPCLLFLNAFGFGAPLLPYASVWWSLATEVQFYLLLPSLPRLMRRGAARLLGVTLLVAYGLAYAAVAGGALHVPSLGGALLLSVSLFGRGPLFLVGIFAGWIYLRHREGLVRQLARLPRGAADLALVALVACLGYLLRWAVYHNLWLVELLPLQAWRPAEGTLWAAILLLLLTAPLLTKRLWSNALLGYLGKVSYSVYLVHFPMLSLGLGGLRRLFPELGVGWSPASAAAVTVLLAATLALSTVTYGLIERPFLVRKERLAR